MKMVRFCAALTLLGMAAGVSTSACATPLPIRVGGDVEHPADVDMQFLQTLPATHRNVAYEGGGNVGSHEYTGVLLWNVLQSAGVIVDPKRKNDILRKIVIVIGADGYQAVFSAGEISPDFGGAQIMIAFEMDGRPIGQDGAFRIVAPGDKRGGRFVSNIVEIKVKDGTK